MKKSDTISKLSGALVKVQKEMGAVTKDASNPFFKSKYADINSVLEVALEALNKHGIAVVQPAYSTETGHAVETYLIHESGEFLASEPLRLELSKIDMQQLGSAITYARRYSLQSLLGMRAEDDDAESTMTRTKTAAKPLAAVTKELLAPVPSTETTTTPKAGGFKKVSAVSSSGENGWT